MVAITVETELDAPPNVVWSDVRRISTHAQWMHDAEAIWFTSESTEGVGTSFECETKVGPIRLSDAMEITEWVDEETIMGDMLREFHALEADVDIPLQLEEFLPAELLASPQAELAEVTPNDRAGLLCAASKMAVDLLDGEEELAP